MEEQGSGKLATKNPAQLALEIFNLLEPYSSEIRQKTVHAALVLLGESGLSAIGSGGRVAEDTAASLTSSLSDFEGTKLGPKALKWAQRNGLTRAMLDEVFYLTDDNVDIIASRVPGPTRREMVVQSYLLSGIRGLLREDTPVLDDGDAIAVCKRLAAYDKNNHTTNRAAVGNRMSGTKPRFTLTGPGEAAAADLIKQMTEAQTMA
jgi:hypothetical protein